MKFTIESDIVDGFRTRCAAAGVSMTSVIRRWMRTGKPGKELTANIRTRPNRRKAVREYISLLNNIIDMESEYRDSIPEQFSQRREAAEQACERMAEAIICLEEAY
jgi:hypothetical protein